MCILNSTIEDCHHDECKNTNHGPNSKMIISNVDQKSLFSQFLSKNVDSTSDNHHHHHPPTLKKFKTDDDSGYNQNDQSKYTMHQSQDESNMQNFNMNINTSNTQSGPQTHINPMILFQQNLTQNDMTKQLPQFVLAPPPMSGQAMYPQMQFYPPQMNICKPMPSMMMENPQSTFLHHSYMQQITNLVALMQQVKDKVDHLTKVTNQIQNELQYVKQSSNKNHKEVEQSSFPQLIGKSPNDSINSQDLLYFLKGVDTQFKYELQIVSELPNPLIRERNFNFTIKLVDSRGQLIENPNRISLSLELYTSDNPPKLLEINTSGYNIIKGTTQKDLMKGVCSFDKIQVKEVTSHFRNGWVFVVIQANQNNSNPVNSNDFVDFTQIKPLIMDKVVVKAKLPKNSIGDGKDSY